MTYSKEIINKEEAERRRKITVRRNNKKYYEKKKEIKLNTKQEKINDENALVAELVKQGKTNSEIANELGCSIRKVQMIKARMNEN